MNGFFLGDHLFAGEEPALLGEQLVFNVDASHAGGLVLANGPLYVQRVSVARVRVADDWDIYCTGDVLGIGNHLSHGQQTHIRESALG